MWQSHIHIIEIELQLCLFKICESDIFLVFFQQNPRCNNEKSQKKQVICVHIHI